MVLYKFNQKHLERFLQSEENVCLFSYFLDKLIKVA